MVCIAASIKEIDTMTAQYATVSALFVGTLAMLASLLTVGLF
jgi:hypothetical protein